MSISSSPSGPPRPVRRPGRAAFRFRLFLMLVVFCGGFYTGVYATARMASAPAWEQSLFRLLPAARSLPPVAPAATAPPAAPVKAPTPAPVPAPPTAAPAPAVTPTAPPANTPPAGDTSSEDNTTSAPAAPQPSSVELADLDSQVKEYNSLLRRIQDTQRTYSAAHQTTLNANAKPGDMQSALDRQNTSLDELISLVQQAQALYDKIEGSPGFADRYAEKELCLPTERVPKDLSELSVDKLRFIRRR